MTPSITRTRTIQNRTLIWARWGLVCQILEIALSGENNNDTVSYFIFLTGFSAPLEITIDADIPSGMEKVIAEDNQNALQDENNPSANCSRISVLQCNSEIFKNKSQGQKQGIVHFKLSKTPSLRDSLQSSSILNVCLPQRQTNQLNNWQTVSLCSRTAHMFWICTGRHAFRGKLKQEYFSLRRALHPSGCVSTIRI
ncbi:hypothetical protein EGW08_009073 [Elysia chlorotica]|uniref:Uncharacterized protein n=1 Tax=Elysia chlorotica TaxID=188477 RepID=A0A433TNL9_ELYCH|nr:hypothetical protein EGW08_009073 [Elysia chlorotica]